MTDIKIESIKVHQKIDKNPDISFIGEYTDKYNDWYICRHCEKYLIDAEKPNLILEAIESRIYDLENELEDEPQNLKKEKALKVLEKRFDNIEPHDCPNSHREYNYFIPYAGGEKPGTKEYKEYGMQDFKRMEQLTNDIWCFTYIYAEAKILIDNNYQTITSMAINSVESDSGDSYIQDLIKEELADLKRTLTALNVNMSQWVELTTDIEIEER